MKNIRIHDKATINGNGTHTFANAKPVICIETGEVFTSVLDAAEYAGVSNPSMVGHLKGRNRTCNGKHYCYLSKATESLDAIVTRLRAASVMEAKAKMWDDMMAEQEERRKEEERRQQAIAKAEAKVASLAEACAKYETKWNETMAALNEAELELEALRGNDNSEAA